jgi:hypothetical protein
MAGVLFLIGAWAVLRVEDPDDVVATPVLKG